MMQNLVIGNSTIGRGGQAMQQLRPRYPVWAAHSNEMNFDVVGRCARSSGVALASGLIQRSEIVSKLHAPYYLPSWYFFQGKNVPFRLCANKVGRAALSDMDIATIRLTNLTRLINEQYGGVRARLAEALDKDQSYVSRWYSTDEEHHRNIGPKSARAIEKVAGKPRGWLDTPIRQEDQSSAAAALYGRIDVALMTRVIRLVEEFDRDRNAGKPPNEWVTLSPETKANAIAQGYEQQAREVHQSDRDKIRRIFKSVADQ